MGQDETTESTPTVKSPGKQWHIGHIQIADGRVIICVQSMERCQTFLLHPFASMFISQTLISSASRMISLYYIWEG